MKIQSVLLMKLFSF